MLSPSCEHVSDNFELVGDPSELAVQMGCCSTKEQGEPAPVETLADNGETKAEAEAEAEAEVEAKAEAEAEAVAEDQAEAQVAAEALAAAEWKAEAQAEVQAEETQVVLTQEELAKRAALVKKMAALPELPEHLATHGWA